MLLLSNERKVESRQQRSGLGISLGGGVDGDVHSVHLQVGVLVGLDLGEVLDVLRDQTKGDVSVSISRRISNSVESNGSRQNQLCQRGHKVGNLLAGNLHFGAHGVALSELPGHDIRPGPDFLSSTAGDLLQQEFLVDHLLVVKNSAGVCAVDGDLGDGRDVLPGSRVHVLGGGLVGTSRGLSRSSKMVGRSEVPWSVLISLSHGLFVDIAHQQHV